MKISQVIVMITGAIKLECDHASIDTSNPKAIHNPYRSNQHRAEDFLAD